MFQGFPFLEKLFDYFHTLTCGFCQQEVYVVKFQMIRVKVVEVRWYGKNLQRNGQNC